MSHANSVRSTVVKCHNVDCFRSPVLSSPEQQSQLMMLPPLVFAAAAAFAASFSPLSFIIFTGRVGTDDGDEAGAEPSRFGRGCCPPFTSSPTIEPNSHRKSSFVRMPLNLKPDKRSTFDQKSLGTLLLARRCCLMDYFCLPFFSSPGSSS